MYYNEDFVWCLPLSEGNSELLQSWTFAKKFIFKNVQLCKCETNKFDANISSNNIHVILRL